MLTKVSSVWKNIYAAKTKSSGVWKNILAGYIKKSGTWKEIYRPMILPPKAITFFTATPDGTLVYDGTNGLLDLIGRFLVAGASEGVDAGANVHDHSYSGSSSTVVGATPRTSETGNTSYKMQNHSHTINHTHASVYHLPPFKEITPCLFYGSVLPVTVRFFFTETTTPDGWEDDSDFDNKFLRDSSGGVATGGSVEHTHLTGNFNTGTTSARTNAATFPITLPCMTDNSHLHTMNHGHAATNHEPPYLTLRLIKPTEETDILPSGVCSFFTGSDIPVGWSYYSTASGKFIKVSTTIGSTGGNATHTHTLSLNTGAEAGNAIVGAGTGTAFVQYMASHYHTANHTHDAVSNLPLSRQLLFCRKD